jgi:DNA topoisomerase IA
MTRKILCVAEKPSIAKSVAQHLSGGQVTTVRVSTLSKEEETEFGA